MWVLSHGCQGSLGREQSRREDAMGPLRSRLGGGARGWGGGMLDTATPGLSGGWATHVRENAAHEEGGRWTGNGILKNSHRAPQSHNTTHLASVQASQPIMGSYIWYLFRVSIS